MAVEIPLRLKYRTGWKGGQRSRHEGNPNNKRHKLKGEALTRARAATAANVPTLWLIGGTHRRWVKGSGN